MNQIAAVDRNRRAVRLSRRRVALAALGALVLVLALGSSRPLRAAGPEPCSPEWLAQGGRGLAAPLALRALPPVADRVQPLPPAAGPSGANLDPSGPSGVVRPNDELYWAGQNNSLPVMRALDAWETTYGGGDITIAVVGDGVDTEHPDLDGRIWQNPRELPNGRDDDGNGYVDDLRGWDFGQGDADPAPWENVADRAEPVLVDKRGTMLAGIAAAETNNRIGVAAINWQARVMPLKVLTLYRLERQGKPPEYIGGAFPEDYTRAVCYAANQGARVLLFASFYLQDVEAAAASLERLRVAINHAYDHGVLTIAPAGDCGVARAWCPDAGRYGANAPVYPAVFNHVVGVQSFRPGGGLRETASYGPWVDIAAPGEGFYTTKPRGQRDGGEANEELYHYIDRGTALVSDFAAAQVAGVVGLMMATNPSYPLERIEQTLCESALRDVGKPYEDGGRNERYGCGLVSAENAVEHMPWQIRVTPGRSVDLTDGRPPWPSQDFVNPYLNDSRWEVRVEVPWLRTEEVTSRPGGPSVGRVVADLPSIPAGMLQAGLVHTETLHACTVGGVMEHCQELQYGLRLVDRLRSVLLPLALSGAR